MHASLFEFPTTTSMVPAGAGVAFCPRTKTKPSGGTIVPGGKTKAIPFEVPGFIDAVEL